MNISHNEFREANSPETSPSRLLELAKHEDCLVRGAVAMNPNSPMECRVILFNDESEHVTNNLIITSVIN